MSIKGVSRFGQYNTPPQIGVGYVYIPMGIDRDEFVQTCYRRSRISIMLDQGGGVINECYITQEVLNNVVFPPSNGLTGTPIVFVTDDFNTKPIVIGTLREPDNYNVREDGEMVHEVSYGNAIVSISGSAKEGTLGISISGQSPNKIFISCVGGEESKIEIEADNEISIKANSKVDVTAYEELSVKMKDVDSEIVSELFADKDSLQLRRDKNIITLDKGNIHIETDKEVNVNGGKEPVALAETTIKKLDTIMQYIMILKAALMNSSTSAPGVPDSAALYKTNITAAITPISSIKFDEIKAEDLFTD
jgi:hypothetical protein